MANNKDRNIEKNILDFLEQTSESYGRISADRFYDSVKSDLYERGISSPIEDIFYISLIFKCHEMGYPVNPYPDYDKSSQKVIYPDGIYIYPQYKVGKYIVDFLVSYQCGDHLSEIVVELDGHKFHDKNKKQRAYEKSRDRYLVKQGYKVFHYTGSEIFNNPFDVSHEVIEEVAKRHNENSKGFD